MVQINIKECDGGKKGEQCRKVIEAACHNFFKVCGIRNIESVCNNLRENLRIKWENQNPDDPMVEYNLPNIPFKRGLEEISPVFKLTEPEIIDIFILKGKKSHGNNGLAVMECYYSENEPNLKKIYAYLDMMDYSNKSLSWRGFNASIEEITYHELLHACGDVEYDGILRHNIIGVECVKKLIAQRKIE